MQEPPGPVLARLLRHGRLTVLVALVALSAGGGAWAAAGAPGMDRVTVLTVADGDTTDGSPSARPPHPDPSTSPRAKPKGTSKAKHKPPKAQGPGRAGEQAGVDAGAGTHGRCVSKVARSDRTGGPHDNHGGAVSAAARSCPHPSGSPTAD